MSITGKAPDRIYVSKDVDALIDVIDSKKYLDLDKSTTTRMELFLFAMSLGIESKTPTTLSSLSQGGLALEQAIKNQDKSLMHAYYINNLPQGETIDSAADKEKVYSMAQEYANTGFHILEEYMQTKPPGSIFWELVKELDEQYERFGKVITPVQD